MQSFVIISKDKQKAREEAKRLVAQEKISKFDVFILETEKSLSISEIRALSTQIFLKPLKGDKKAIIIECFFGATIQAQNAFLKILEEPPLSTTIIMLSNSNFFIPTILSRATLIELDKKFELEKNEEEQILNVLNNLSSMTIGEKLKLAESLSKEKETALEYLEKMIVSARNSMVSDVKRAGEYKNMIEILQKYYKEIKQSNVNLRLGLENLFLEI